MPNDLNNLPLLQSAPVSVQTPAPATPASAPAIPASAPQNNLPGYIANAPTPQPAPPTGKQPGLFRRLLLGALAGVAAPYEQEQAQTANMQADTAYRQQITQNAQAQAGYDSQRAQDAHALAQAQIAAIPDERARDKAENAYYQARAAIAARQLAVLPANAQEQSLQDLDGFTRSAVSNGAQFYAADTSAGFSPEQSGTASAAMALQQRLTQRDNSTKNGAQFDYVIGTWNVGGKRTFGVIQIPSAVDRQAVTRTPTRIQLSDGSSFTFPAGTPQGQIVKAQFDVLLRKIDQAHSDEVSRRTNQVKAITDSITELQKQKGIDGTLPPKTQQQINILQNRRASLLGLPPVQQAASQLTPGQIPTGATVATNKAGQKIYTTDGGRTWIDPTTQRPLQ